MEALKNDRSRFLFNDLALLPEPGREGGGWRPKGDLEIPAWLYCVGPIVGGALLAIFGEEDVWRLIGFSAAGAGVFGWILVSIVGGKRDILPK